MERWKLLARCGWTPEQGNKHASALRYDKQIGAILVVTAPAARRGLTTVAMVKRELGITGSADHDVMEDLILQASAAIEGWCRRVFPREDVSETFRLSAERPVLSLARWPNVAMLQAAPPRLKERLGANIWSLSAMLTSRAPAAEA